MSGAQGAQPMGSFTTTTYHTAPGSVTEDPPKMAIRSDKDEPGLLVNKLEDKIKDVAGLGGPIFGAGIDDGKPDLGVAGTSYTA
ncbi:uncharacterized protein LOC144546262 [Carex rostrata]